MTCILMNPSTEAWRAADFAGAAAAPARLAEAAAQAARSSGAAELSGDRPLAWLYAARAAKHALTARVIERNAGGRPLGSMSPHLRRHAEGTLGVRLGISEAECRAMMGLAETSEGSAS